MSERSCPAELTACLSENALEAMSDESLNELCAALLSSNQCEAMWGALSMAKREYFFSEIAQRYCAAGPGLADSFAELGYRAARWAMRYFEMTPSQSTVGAHFLSELLIVRHADFLKQVERAAGPELLERLAREGLLFANGMTLSNSRRLSFAFDALDEGFERACLIRDLEGPQMLLARQEGEGEEREPYVRCLTESLKPERRRMGGFGLLGLATGPHEPFRRAMDLLRERGFDPERECLRRAEHRSYGSMEFPPHNCLTGALFARNASNARLILKLCPLVNAEEQMRELVRLMKPVDDDPEGERLREDIKRAQVLAQALEIERASGEGRGSTSSSGARSRSI